MTIKDALYGATTKLIEGNVSEPEKSAEFLLRQILKWDKAKLLVNPDYELSSSQEKKFCQYIERRKKHEPVWYITGKVEFYGLDLEVNQNVLIPRPETEFLVEEVLQSIKHTKDIKILEVGTGSGAIILALVSKLKRKVYVSDISGDALKIAKKNAKKLQLDKFIEFREGDLLTPWAGKKFDIIVANLPYIPHEDMGTLALDIHHFEPRIALDGGKEGLEIYKRQLSQAKDYLNDGAMMFFEIGIDQGEKIKSLASKHLPNARVKIKKDYGNIDRIAIIKT